MKPKRQPPTMHLLLLLLGAGTTTARLLETATPHMGWNSYNFYNCYPDESIILQNAHGLATLGLADLGYVYLNVDCGWPSPQRDAEDGNRMVWNPDLFPSGVEFLADEIHSLGLKFGVYSGGGYGQCGNGSLPASLGYEAIDAVSFAEWGADSLKYDNCFATDGVNMVDYDNPEYGSPERFNYMSAEIDAVDRDIIYQVCQWGCGTDLGEWAPPVSNSYRISNDIYNSWRSIWRIANQVIPYAKHTGPGSFPDMDMLVIGVGGQDRLTPIEERFHFSLWSIAKSPLIIGLPLLSSPAPDPSSLAIISNQEVIALNQDPLAKPATLRRRYTEEEWDLWAGPLSGDRLVVALANWNAEPQTVRVDLARTLGVEGAQARDVWAAEDLGTVSGVFEADLAGHELRLLVLSNIETSSVGEPISTGYHPAQAASLTGTASLRECSTGECLPADAKIGNITPNSTATFTSVLASSAGTKLVAVDFINYDVAMATGWEWGSNTRNLTIAVNGGADQAKRWAFPLSGGDWYEAGRLFVEVDGFEATEDNTVVFGGYQGDQYAPDLVGFEVLEFE